MFTLTIKKTHKRYPHKNLYKKTEVNIIVSQAKARGRENVKDYLTHKYPCPMRLGSGQFGECNCGLSDLLTKEEK